MSEPVNKLKKCPFCGCVPKIWFNTENINCLASKVKVQIYCRKCNATIEAIKEIMFSSYTNPGYAYIELEREAEDAWNKREGR